MQPESVDRHEGPGPPRLLALSVDRVLSLRRFARSYLDVVERADYALLRTLQPPPFASVAYGAGGIAYLLWRTGRIEHASRWIESATRDRSRDALAKTGAEIHGYSVLCGRAGLAVVRALVAHDAGDVAGRRRACRAFVRHCRAAASASPEIFQGRAGLLAAATILARHLDDGALLAVASSLARGIARDLPSLVGRTEMSRSFAHGTMGPCFALLEHARVAAVAPPPAALRELERLARQVAPRRRAETPSQRSFRSSWCRGAAGEVLLWAKAHQLDAHPDARARARAAGRVLLAHRGLTLPSLCCGETGWAFACLALERIDGGRGWGDHAETFAARASSADNVGGYPSGLAWGYPGLVAFDAARRHGHGFPLLE